jgi:hypothetical protein
MDPTMNVPDATVRDVRAALVLLDKIAERHYNEFTDEPFDLIADARDALREWVEPEDQEAGPPLREEE